MKSFDTIRLRTELLSWYRRSRRSLPWRETFDPYHIWVSEVMLQQTQVRTVIPYYNAFIARFPSVDVLAAAEMDDVLKAWEGLGYYARARNLHTASAIVVDRHGGNVPNDSESFRRLPGVGDYICNAVQSIAFEHPLAVVDTNVKRVISRLAMIDDPVNRPKSDAVFKKIAEELLDREVPGTFNQAMMELGALVCRPTSPACHECPVAGQCRSRLNDRVADFPVRGKRREIPLYRIAVGVVERDGRMLITRRPESGLLGGLWEFPGGKLKDGEQADAAVRREIAEEVGLDVAVREHLTTVHHAYTHFKVELEVFRCRSAGGDVVLDGPVDYRWITFDEINNFAFPGANRKFLPILEKAISQSND